MMTFKPTSTPDASPRKHNALIAAIVAAGLLLAGFAGFTLWQNRQHALAEQAIRRVMELRASALSQKDIPRYLSCFSDTYQAGSKSYADLQADAQQWSTAFDTIELQCRILDMQMQENAALVENLCKVTVTSAGETTTMPSSRERFEVQRIDGEWKIVGARPLR